MAKDFVFRSEWLELINELSKDEQPAACRAVVLYCSTGKNIRLSDAAGIVFSAIKKDIAKREQISKIRKEAGSKGGKSSWNFAQAKLKQSSSKARAKPEQSPSKKPQSTQNQTNNECSEELDPINSPYQEGEETEKKKNPPIPPKRKKDKDEEKNNAREVFQKPTIDEVARYIDEMGYIVDANRFHAWYESNGWRVGKNPMKNWKAAVTSWNYNKPNENGNTAHRSGNQSVEDRQHQETLTAMRFVGARGESDVDDLPF